MKQLLILIAVLFCFDLAAQRRDTAPKPGADAPDFKLKTMDGRKTVKLSSFEGKKPVVLVFGSITWGPFCEASVDVNKLHQKYGKDFEFVLVYIREAHPIGGRRENQYSIIEDPETLKERQKAAQMSAKKLKFKFTITVDEMDNTVNKAYSAWPERLFVVDKKGSIAYAGERGPWGFKPTKDSKSVKSRNGGGRGMRNGDSGYSKESLEEFLDGYKSKK